LAGTARPEPPGRPTPDEVIARARVHLALITVLGVFMGFVGLGTLALMIVPLAHAIAGTHTVFSFTLGVSVSATLAVSTILSGGFAVIQSRRVRWYREQTRALEKRLGYTPGGEVNSA
jgi:hypothetical protein